MHWRASGESAGEEPAPAPGRFTALIPSLPEDAVIESSAAHLWEIPELLERRRIKHAEAESQGWLLDAWGNRRSALWIEADARNNIPSLWSYVIQSYELRLILAALPVIKKHQQVYLLATHHDSITVMYGNKGKARWQLKAVVKAIESEAERLRIPVAVESALLQ